MQESGRTQQTAVIIVTHNSAAELEVCLQGLAGQSAPPEFICIVDSGSEDTGYLRKAVAKYGGGVNLLLEENVGFSQGNNVGYHHVPEETEYVMFVNPDTLLDKSFVARARQVMARNREAAVVTGRLLGYDFSRQCPTGLIDSTGIYRKWYGRWYDRAQGEEDSHQYLEEEDIPAACGALMFCRKRALGEVLLSDSAVFDPGFFLYKEDIDLSLRLRKAGWKIRYVPALVAFHGRGWQRDRKRMTRAIRLAAADSEVLLYSKHPSPYMIWAVMKYLLVRIFDV